MKKILKITGISIAILLLVILLIPFALKGKLADIVKAEGNKMLNAQFDFEELDISLFRHFPSATVSLEEFWLKGTGEFASDTLAKAKEVSATVNLFSLFGDSGYEISKILLDKVQVHAIVSEDGASNWDILKPTADKKEVEKDTKTKSPFRIRLEQLSAEGLSVIYDDRKGNMLAAIEDFSATCSGDFGSERTLLRLNAATPAVTYSSNGMAFLNKVKVAASMDIDADFQKGLYTLKDNKLELNAIETNLDGWMKQTPEGWDMDVKLYSNKMGFKEILSLIPGMYAKDFDQLKTDGKVAVTAYAKGLLKGDSVVPAFAVNLNVENGMFKYPSLPGGVDHINIAIAVKNPGGNPDSTIVDVHPFNFIMAGHPFGVNARLKTPVSDLDFELMAKGRLDLGKVKEVYPLSGMELNGKMDADMRIAGRLSAIEKGRYEEIQAGGRLTLNDMALTLADLPKMKIEKSILSFSPRILKLDETTVKIGNNDVTFDSQFENYLAYAFKKKTLKGTLNVKSNYLNLTDFMTKEDTTAVADSVPSAENAEKDADPAAGQQPKSGIVIPDNIDFRMETNLKQVLLDSLKFENIHGLLIIKDQKVDMSNLSMNTMGGKMVANGAYATPKGKQATLNGSFALQDLSFKQTYKELDVIKQLAPIFDGLKGTYSGNITIDSRLDEQLSMDVMSLQGKGNLSTSDLSLSDVKSINQVAEIVKKPELKEMKVDNLNLDFTIDDGRVTTQPFDLRLGDYSMNLSGSTGLDQTIDYRGKIKIPVSAHGKKRYGMVDMLIKGTFDKPEVSIDMESLALNLASQVFDSLTDEGETQEGDSLKPKKKNIFDKALDLFKKKK